jgi:hypothetical protein
MPNDPTITAAQSFPPESRYAPLGVAAWRAPDGTEVSYVRRRLVPRADELPLLTRARVLPGDRLDLLTARALGDPLLFWRIADANDAMSPAALVARAGRMLRVPAPQFRPEGS